MSLHMTVWNKCDGCDAKTAEYTSVDAALRGAKEELFDFIKVNGAVCTYCMDCAPRIKADIERPFSLVSVFKGVDA